MNNERWYRRWWSCERLQKQTLSATIELAAGIIVSSHCTVALTGAGISTPSGIPDFRSPGSGLWMQADPMEVASLAVFQHQPQVFYDWVRPLLKAILEAIPNAAHIALADLERMGLLQVVITQNIDGLHQKAGSQTVLEVHGGLNDATCLRCYALTPVSSFVDAFLETGEVPRCPSCGGVLKPNIVFFGEMLPVQTFWCAQQLAEKCEVMLVVGSSLEVQPAGGLPARAVEHGAQLIIANREPTYLDPYATVLLREDVADVLPQIVTACRRLREVA